MSKPCPECRKMNDTGARICSCGYLFINSTTGIKTVELTRARREISSRRIKKYLVLSALAVLVVGALAWFGGLTGFPWSSDESEISDPHDELTKTSKPANSVLNPTNDGAKNAVEGRVTEIVDGQTIRVKAKNGQEYRIVLGGIDAPGLNEAFGSESKASLAGMILGKPVLVILQRTDTEGNLTGKVIFEGKDINREQVKAGMARFAKGTAEQTEADRKLYADAETTAQNNRQGLWSGANPNLTAQSENIENPALLTVIPGNTEIIPGNTETLPANKQEITRSPDSALTAGIQPEKTPGTPSKQSAVNNQPTQPFRSITSPTVINEPGVNESQVDESRSTELLTTATARCKDGTLSFSAIRQGACSRHGGVAEWLGGAVLREKSIQGIERTYRRGARGGCYYINSGGNKTYVDKALCN